MTSDEQRIIAQNGMFKHLKFLNEMNLTVPSYLREVKRNGYWKWEYSMNPHGENWEHISLIAKYI